MKKQLYLLLTLFVLASTSLVAAEIKPNAALTENQAARAEQISIRVNEIKNMDKSALSRQDRKDLRNELKEMKKEAKAMTGGVYLSVGAIIIIILLLILIL